jgi:tetratricopeptide (TPR) repeat protein
MPSVRMPEKNGPVIEAFPAGNRKDLFFMRIIFSLALCCMTANLACGAGTFQLSLTPGSRDVSMLSSAEAVTGDEPVSRDPEMAQAAEVYSLWNARLPESPEARAENAAWLRFLGLDAEQVAAAYLGMGMQLYNNEEYEASMPFLEVARMFYPEDAELLKRFGFACKESGRYEKARGLLLLYLAGDDSDFYAWWWLSDTQRLLGEYDNALENMLRARELAPPERREELTQYVEYTRHLGSDEKTIETMQIHGQFAERHKEKHRIRRFIAEYINVLEKMPPARQDEKPFLIQTAWTNTQIGIQYNYLNEADVASDYFIRAIGAFRRAGNTADVMRQEQHLALAWERMARTNRKQRGRCLENALKAWLRSFELAQSLQDIEYLRYVRGALLGLKARLYGVEDHRVKTLREENRAEIPWQGPINEYATAEAVAGEIICRMAEGDYAGARILIDMVMPYFDASEFLIDNERAAGFYTDLARVYHVQGHYEKALECLDKAETKVDTLRRFIDSGAFDRGPAGLLLRRIYCARMRAAAALEQPGRALDFFEKYKAGELLDMLGARIRDEGMYTDITTEHDLIRRRIPLLEADLAAAKAAEDASEISRLEMRLEKDRKRMEWLDRGIRFVPPRELAFEPVPARQHNAIQQHLPAAHTCLALITDTWGGCAVIARRGAITAVLLPDADEASVRGALDRFHATREENPEEAVKTLEQLYTLIIAPVRPQLDTEKLCFAADTVLSTLPFEALSEEGRPLISDFETFSVPALSYLLFAAEVSPTPSGVLRMILPDAGLESLSNVTGLAIEKAVGDDATETAATRNTPPGALLHIGCEADFTVPEAMLCTLLLRPDKKNDGRLAAAEILAASIPAALAVLDLHRISAEPHIRGVHLEVFAETFRHAGTPRLLANRWTVPDKEREIFFAAFYEAVPENGFAAAVLSARQALRQAAPDSLNWAAFLMLGF